MAGKTIVFLLCALCLMPPVKTQGYEVHGSHPRLFFRDSVWGPHTATTALLRQRAGDPRYAPFLGQIERRSPCNYALKAVMLDDREAGLEAIEMIENREGFGSTTDAGRVLMWDAMAFDWLYNMEYFSEESKNRVIENLARGAEHCREIYRTQGTHIFHTRMYGYPTGVAIAGLALEGHHPKAREYSEWAREVYTRDLFPARRLQDGSVHSSMAYGRKYIMWLVGHFLSAWYSATGENFWRMIREEQDDWAWKAALFCIYAEQPDGRMIRFGDNFFRGTERFSFRAVAERMVPYDEPVGYGYVDYLFERHKDGTGDRIGTEMGMEYLVFICWDPDHRAVARNTLPGRMLFSPTGTGMAFWRTGWEEHDTFIFSKCGDYFDNHGHFDAGHVEIFRRAPLLIEGGSYAGGTSTDHYRRYFHQSISHNTVQIVDPSNPEDDGSQRFYNNQGQGTFEEYMANPDNEYGDVIAWQDREDLAYLAAEFSAAYPEGRVERLVRELAWIGERFLVVVDNITLTDSRYQPRILWHYPVKPESLGETSFTVSDAGARAVVNVLAPAGARIDTVPAWTVCGVQYPPARNPRPELGAGRAEVHVPGAGRTGYMFVQVIDVADNGVDTASGRLLGEAEEGSVRIELPAGTLLLEGPPGSRTTLKLE